MTKYNNKKIEVDGILFDSKHEAEYYIYLKKKKKKGEIAGFELQPKFELIPKFEKEGIKNRAITYTPDFKVIYPNNDIEIIDVKGYSTQQGNLRKKLFDYAYPHLKLIWITKNLKHGDADGWIEHEELKKKRRKNK